MAPHSIAAIFAHPDDEVLGCGASLAAHAQAGDRVRILLLATGLAARGDAPDTAIQALQEDARAAAGVLGAASVEFAEFPDNAMDSVPLLTVVQRIEMFLADDPPEVVYTHHGGDLNIDHRLTFEAVLTACRPLPGPRPAVILACEVNSSTEWAAAPLRAFRPTEYLDATGALAQKLQALACYTGELRDWPHPRSIEGVRTLARRRGSEIGIEAAEAFELVRRIRSTT